MSVVKIEHPCPCGLARHLADGLMMYCLVCCISFLYCGLCVGFYLGRGFSLDLWKEIDTCLNTISWTRVHNLPYPWTLECLILGLDLSASDT
jgi:hypothetical protein